MSQCVLNNNNKKNQKSLTRRATRCTLEPQKEKLLFLYCDLGIYCIANLNNLFKCWINNIELESPVKLKELQDSLVYTILGYRGPHFT